METSPFVNEATPTNLAGKTIIVMGGATGIGRATARLPSGLGARVLICGRTEQDMKDALTDMPREVESILTDLSTLAGVKKLFEYADHKLGAIDILVNNAALPIDGTAKVDPEEIEYVIRSNLLNYVQCTRQALERMIPRKAGHILCIGR